MPPSATTADICLHCGVCCTGAMFDRVPLETPEDREALRRHGEKVDDDARSFSLPCRFQEGTRCSIHHDRPRVCGAYRCLVLERAQRGQMPVVQAVAKARELRRLYERLRAAMPDGEKISETHERLAALKKAGSPPGREDASLMLAYYLFTAFLDAHFHRPSEKRMRYLDGAAPVGAEDVDPG